MNILHAVHCTFPMQWQREVVDRRTESILVGNHFQNAYYLIGTFTGVHFFHQILIYTSCGWHKRMLTDFLLYKMLLVSWLWSIISDQIDTYEIYLLSKLESKFATWYAIKRDKKKKKKKKNRRIILTVKA